LIQELEFIPKPLQAIKNPPKKLFYSGDLTLLDRPKVAIVGSRRAISYTKEMVAKLSNQISKNGGVVVSGAAMGVDGIAHLNANNQTIAIMPCSLDIIYPQANRNLIQNIYKNSLAISEYPPTTQPTNYSFVVRNRLVVGLSSAVVIAQADIDSGSIRSAEIAIANNKPIFVLPHRLGDSDGTNQLIKDSKANVIYDIDEFIESIGIKKLSSNSNDEIIEFCIKSVSLDEALIKFGDIIYEYEFLGKISIQNGKIVVL